MISPGTTRKRSRDERRRRIREQVIQLDHICSGSLIRRTKVCGKAECACASDRAARHGPYYEWSHMEKGRRVCTSVPGPVAVELTRAIRNHRRLRRLMQLWEEDSARVLLEGATRKTR